jgi:hypothetical protein
MPNWPLTSAATPGNAASPNQRRTVASAVSSIPTGWRRRSAVSAVVLELISGSG